MILSGPTNSNDALACDRTPTDLAPFDRDGLDMRTSRETSTVTSRHLIGEERTEWRPSRQQAGGLLEAPKTIYRNPG